MRIFLICFLNGNFTVVLFAPGWRGQVSTLIFLFQRVVYGRSQQTSAGMPPIQNNDKLIEE
ncbi:hypothetical protein HA51_00195 [Pantoea rwandensis]|uniref:Uncharacterized protein n=1 Tax=Pantoea rwandensis TaxID=1076550 RepID=A0A1X1D4V2_9GAMM|nr:hypothetical protein HA51_00195 [Pantoea rwandensis]